MPDSPIGENKSETGADRDRADRRDEAPVGQPFWALQISQTPQPVKGIVRLFKRHGDGEQLG